MNEVFGVRGGGVVEGSRACVFAWARRLMAQTLFENRRSAYCRPVCVGRHGKVERIWQKEERRRRVMGVYALLRALLAHAGRLRFGIGGASAFRSS
jgi:hypothetical protein